MLGSPEFRAGLVAGLLAAFVVYVLLSLAAVVVRPWAMAWAAGVRVGVPYLVGMRLRGTPPELIVTALVIDQKRGGSHTLGSLETAGPRTRAEAATLRWIRVPPPGVDP